MTEAQQAERLIRALEQLSVRVAELRDAMSKPRMPWRVYLALQCREASEKARRERGDL